MLLRLQEGVRANANQRWVLVAVSAKMRFWIEAGKISLADTALLPELRLGEYEVLAIITTIWHPDNAANHSRVESPLQDTPRLRLPENPVVTQRDGDPFDDAEDHA